MTRFAAWLTLWLTAIAAAAQPTTRESRLAIARELWEAKLAAVGDSHVVAEHYPSEEALPFLSAYAHTRDPRYAAAAARQLEYAHSRDKDGIFLTSTGVANRDYQARQTYNFYLAYRILADGRYLRWADDGAAAMLRIIPRESHVCAGQTHTLFLAGFITPSGERRQMANVIDVNQNAEVALAYSLLYHDPASAFFRSPIAKEIAYEELLASMSIQDMTSGAIPLTENIPGADTAYGSYAAFSWVWCQLLWREDKFEPHVRAAGRWLAPKMNLAADSDRYYPTVARGYVPYWEAYFRLPLLWYCDVSANHLVGELLERTWHPEATPGDKSFAPALWASYDLMGVPREYYLDGAAPVKASH
jgi:hypothetical protein